MLQILAFTLLLATAGEPQTTTPAEPPAVTAPAQAENAAPATPAPPSEMICRTVREDGGMGSNTPRRRRVCTPREPHIVPVAPTGSETSSTAPAPPVATTEPQTQSTN